MLEMEMWGGGWARQSDVHMSVFPAFIHSTYFAKIVQ
jgi:hypothetical protein